MSQRMEYDEVNAGYSGVRQPEDYDNLSGNQKIGHVTFREKETSSNHRLALAIWSVIGAVASMGILVAIVSKLQGLGVIVGLLAMVMVCLTIMVINITFNYKR